jgi:signal transduction histidine kinase
VAESQFAYSVKAKFNRLTGQYSAALSKHLEAGPKAGSQPALRLGRQAVALGLETLDLALIHEQAVIARALPSSSPALRDQLVKRAGRFFAEAITPLEETHRLAQEEERRKISRELHGVIAQVLTGINVQFEMVGGKLTVESTPGQGTTIQVRIPLGNDPKAGTRL